VQQKVESRRQNAAEAEGDRRQKTAIGGEAKTDGRQKTAEGRFKRKNAEGTRHIAGSKKQKSPEDELGQKADRMKQNGEGG
jgi:hypothetical protein